MEFIAYKCSPSFSNENLSGNSEINLRDRSSILLPLNALQNIPVCKELPRTPPGYIYVITLMQLPQPFGDKKLCQKGKPNFRDNIQYHLRDKHYLVAETVSTRCLATCRSWLIPASRNSPRKSVSLP